MDMNTTNNTPYIAPGSGVAGSGLSAIGSTPATTPAPVSPMAAAGSGIPDTPDSNMVPRRRFNMKAMLGAAAMVIMLLGGFVAFTLSQQEQDISNQAAAGRCDAFNPGKQGTCRLNDYFGNPCWTGGGTNLGDVGSCQPDGVTGNTNFCSCVAGGGEDESEEETGTVEDDPNECGAEGQPCCATGTICGANLYCTNGTCNSSSAGLCNEDKDSPGDGEFNNTCALYVCEGGCNYSGGTECRLERPTGTGDCEAMVSQLGTQCGQVDYLKGNGLYCGVKALQCNGGGR